MNLQIYENKIFELKNNEEFEKLSLEIFNYQAKNNLIYNQYLKYLNINPEKITSIKEIPFLPIEFFKNHKVITNFDENKKYLQFKSSGTTAPPAPQRGEIINSSVPQFPPLGGRGALRSTHYIYKVSVYEKSFISGFSHFYGDIENYTVLALLPSYLERNDSSLVYMVDKLITLSKNKDSGFYLNNLDELASKLNYLIEKKQKVILFGVSFALLELAEKYNFNENEIIIMETGGMKGRREELIRAELHKILINNLGVKTVHSEYGMTELLSQAYSKGHEIFETPSFMKIMIRDTNDPFSYLPNGKTGGINVIDLANLYSCSFIETKDLGKILEKNKFEILGRFDNSDIRGCNLLI